MKGFGQLVTVLLAAIPVIGAIAAIVFAVQLVIAFFPVIVGLLVLLFIGYVFFVGLCNLGRDDKAK